MNVLKNQELHLHDAGTYKKQAESKTQISGSASGAGLASEREDLRPGLVVPVKKKEAKKPQRGSRSEQEAPTTIVGGAKLRSEQAPVFGRFLWQKVL